MFKKIVLVICFFCLISFAHAESSVRADKYKIPKLKYPDFGKGELVKGDISVSKVKLKVPDWGPLTLVVYRPTKRKGSMPVVFVPPAGTNLITGADISDSYHAEQLPYVKAGCIVVHYSLPGAVDDKMNDQQYGISVSKFMNSKIGVLPALVAIDYALNKIPDVNSDMLVTAGHSSAGTLSLQVAMSSGKITHCIAYAPAASYLWMGKKRLDELLGILPAFKTCVAELDPINNTKKLKVPTFIFGAQDDSIVSIKDTFAYAKKLKRSNSKVIIKMVKTGEHYDSMIKKGIPQAIKWIKMHEKKLASKQKLKK